MESSNLPGGGVQLALNLPISAIQTSLLTLTVAADDVAFVVNRAPAQIQDVQVGAAHIAHAGGQGCPCLDSRMLLVAGAAAASTSPAAHLLRMLR